MRSSWCLLVFLIVFPISAFAQDSVEVDARVAYITDLKSRLQTMVSAAGGNPGRGEFCPLMAAAISASSALQQNCSVEAIRRSCSTERLTDEKQYQAVLMQISESPTGSQMYDQNYVEGVTRLGQMVERRRDCYQRMMVRLQDPNCTRVYPSFFSDDLIASSGPACSQQNVNTVIDHLQTAAGNLGMQIAETLKIYKQMRVDERELYGQLVKAKNQKNNRQPSNSEEGPQ